MVGTGRKIYEVNQVDAVLEGGEEEASIEPVNVPFIKIS